MGLHKKAVATSSSFAFFWTNVFRHWTGVADRYISFAGRSPNTCSHAHDVDVDILILAMFAAQIVNSRSQLSEPADVGLLKKIHFQPTYEYSTMDTAFTLDQSQCKTLP